MRPQLSYPPQHYQLKKYFPFFATLPELACLINDVNDTTGYTLSDKSLVSSVLRGETDAFSAIIKNTEALTAQIVFKMIENVEDRKDVAQDIYLKVFDKLSGFRFESKLSTWIAQISYNTCLSYLEKKKLVFPGQKEPERNYDDDSGFFSERDNAPFTSETETAVSKKELSGILKTEIENLPPIYKTLISLFHHEELSYDEITRIVGLPVGTVKSYLFRARKMLKENLLLQYKKEEL
jgi:RNA polymerase sigma factor (sigma-70 family)